MRRMRIYAMKSEASIIGFKTSKAWRVLRKMILERRG